MTRHGTLAYYLAAWVCGCFFMSTAIFLRFYARSASRRSASLHGAVDNFWLFSSWAGFLDWYQPGGGFIDAAAGEGAAPALHAGRG